MSQRQYKRRKMRSEWASYVVMLGPAKRILAMYRGVFDDF